MQQVLPKHWCLCSPLHCIISWYSLLWEFQTSKLQAVISVYVVLCCKYFSQYIYIYIYIYEVRWKKRNEDMLVKLLLLKNYRIQGFGPFTVVSIVSNIFLHFFPSFMLPNIFGSPLQEFCVCALPYASVHAPCHQNLLFSWNFNILGTDKSCRKWNLVNRMGVPLLW